MMTIEVEIEGTAPGLLMHRFPQANYGGAPSPNPGPEHTPEGDAEGAAYRDNEGHLCQPSEHIFQSMVKVASDFQIKGRGKKTYKDLVKGGLLLSPDLLQHESDTYLIDSRPVVIQRARIVRHRPLLPSWRLAFTIQVIDDGIPFDVLNQILVRAGQLVGIGDYRPRYGRFVVSKFKQV